ncbi:hypothetical protein HYT59_02835 [Candidatus Woesebacteria bacterium]|nr:hypothetical protein [Candidatus Woesebacteria bacterium]
MMKTTINLLPSDIVGPKTDIRELKSNLNKIAIILASVFIIAGVASGGYMLFLTTDIGKVRAESDEIVNSIKELQAVETKFVLVRDRVDRAKSFLGEASASKNVGIFSEITSTFPEGVILSEAKVRKDLMEIGFSARSSKDISVVFAALGEREDIQKVELANFSFTSTQGYVVRLNITLK